MICGRKQKYGNYIFRKKLYFIIPRTTFHCPICCANYLDVPYIQKGNNNENGALFSRKTFPSDFGVTPTRPSPLQHSSEKKRALQSADAPYPQPSRGAQACNRSGGCRRGPLKSTHTSPLYQNNQSSDCR